jgi:hypothetical protein
MGLLSSALPLDMYFPSASYDVYFTVLYDELTRLRLSTTTNPPINQQNEAKEMHKHLASLGDANSTMSDRLYHLELLEDLVGTVDNAQDFARMGGLEVCALLLSAPESEADTEVKASAALLIGSASKYVNEVQLKAHSIGLLSELLGHMTQPSACGATDQDAEADMLCSRLM